MKQPQPQSRDSPTPQLWLAVDYDKL
jgi:hypothetical protein